jgi:large subunit ribosomal protein L23
MATKTKEKSVAVKNVPTGKIEKSVIIRPRISDKAYRGTENRHYTFDVLPNATKPEIRREVARKYNVKVSGVSTVLTSGKVHWFHGQITEKPSFKKAIVTLAPGEKIELI